MSSVVVASEARFFIVEMMPDAKSTLKYYQFGVYNSKKPGFLVN